MRLTSIRRFPSRVKRAVKYEIHAHWRGRPIEQGTVLYESFSGNGMLCNPEAIFRRLLADPELGHLRHIWVLSSLHEYRDTVREFRDAENVSFVRYGSSAYLRALATSQYLVNNATFPPEFSKRDGQTYLNTWHGTPLKRMGYDIEGGALDTANITRNFVQADYLLAANAFMSDQMYGTGYKLRGIYRGKIIEDGYPRIDRQVLDAGGVAAGRARLRDAGIPIGERKIVLYAPTWKGESFGDPLDDIDELLARVGELESRIDTSRYVILLKTHQIVHRMARKRPELKRMLVSNSTPTNVILGLTDVLITDYSSIFYDFLPTSRPILFFTPDLDDYEGSRGLYVEPAEWPGPVSRTIEDLARDLIEADRTGGLPADIAARYRRDQSVYCEHEDGDASGRVVDVVFRGREEGVNIRSDHSDGRTSILLYLGGMRANGITTSALNLLNNIDHDRFDVSAFFAFSRSRVALEKADAIGPEVRQFPRVGGMNGSKFRQLQRRTAYRRGRLAEHAADPVQRALWDDEWARCFGQSRFDYVIDFSGYGPFWSVLMLHSPDAVRSIWLHNDMAADAHREVNGSKNMLHSLTQVFTLYPQYDRLVSVSPALAEINRRKLAAYSEPSKFVSAINSVDPRPIVEGAEEDLREAARDPETGEYPEWVDTLRIADGTKRFVTVGRLSPEKNQARLIRAFAQVHATDPATRLVIVGAGPLADDLQALADRLGVSDAVTLTGQQSNPHAIMAASDCFVLSSDYEGQPMVILEALVLGLPIVTVAFASARSALPDGIGLVVDQSDAALADGMRAYLRGDVPTRAFGPADHNRVAVDQFVAAIGVPAHHEGTGQATRQPAEAPLADERLASASGGAE